MQQIKISQDNMAKITDIIRKLVMENLQLKETNEKLQDENDRLGRVVEQYHSYIK